MMIDMVSPARRPSLAARVVEGIDRLGLVPTGVFQALFRVAVGAVFFKSGLTKIANWDTTLALFANEYNLPILPPDIVALLGTTAELACPVLLVLGLASRLATLPLLAMTITIQLLVYPENWAEHLTWFGMLGFILTRGPGPVSLDALIAPLLLDRRSRR